VVEHSRQVKPKSKPLQILYWLTLNKTKLCNLLLAAALCSIRAGSVPKHCWL
jgi:hypothetical protein